jgi:hypothetical protein
LKMFAALAVRSVTSKGQKAALSPKSFNKTVKLLLFTRSKHLLFLDSCFLCVIVSSTEWISPCHPGKRSWSCALPLFANTDDASNDDRITGERRERKTIVKRIVVVLLVLSSSWCYLSLSRLKERRNRRRKLLLLPLSRFVS